LAVTFFLFLVAANVFLSFVIPGRAKREPGIHTH
jgi:hypothetical protein